MTQTIGLIGCGSWGKYILRDLVSLKANVLVHSPSEATRQFAIQQGALEAHPHLNDMAERVEGFVVATPTSTHADVIEKLLPFKKPIFVEKPLTDDLQSAKRFAELAPDTIFVMDKWRYHPGIDTLANKIREGVVGPLESIRSYRLNWGNPHPDVTPLWILLPHDLSIILHLLGTLPPLYSVVPLIPGRPTLGILLTLKGPDTPTVIIEISTLSLTKRRNVTVVGEKGSLELSDGYDNHLLYAEGKPGDIGATRQKISIDETMPLYLELAAFLDYLKGGPPPQSSLQEGLLVVETIDAVHQALEAA